MLAGALLCNMNPILVLRVRRRLSRYHPGMSFGDDFEWLDDDAIVGYSVSFVEAVEPVEALKRIGAVVDAVPELSAAEADEFASAAGDQSVIRAGRHGPWTVLIEHDANKGVNERTLPALSAGTRAVSVFSSASGMDLFYYAEDGRLTTTVETTIPANRYGEQPDRFLRELSEVGLAPDDEPESARAATMALVRSV
ncbi:DUF6461 domain-containing protein [Saccharopolyspora sp. NPDC050389]|uniref:DUF6461 domain-containing protein n=1 Tax=Saccharopolyspora sp. NPDC050389 TaxID=3155516 RepID=UPI0033CF56EE